MGSQFIFAAIFCIYFHLNFFVFFMYLPYNYTYLQNNFAMLLTVYFNIYRMYNKHQILI
jgi:hypothetical protein